MPDRRPGFLFARPRTRTSILQTDPAALACLPAIGYNPGRGARMSTRTTYHWLEPKPYKKHTRQLGIKGRNMIVWNLVADIVVAGATPDEIARRFRLPVEAVQEALDYYDENKEWIDAEVDVTGRQF